MCRALPLLLLPLALVACSDSDSDQRASVATSSRESVLDEVSDAETCDALLGTGGRQSPLDQVQKIWNGGTIGPAQLSQVRAGLEELDAIAAQANVVLREQLETMIEETDTMVDNAMSSMPERMSTREYKRAGLLVTDLWLVADPMP